MVAQKLGEWELNALSTIDEKKVIVTRQSFSQRMYLNEPLTSRCFRLQAPSSVPASTYLTSRPHSLVKRTCIPTVRHEISHTSLSSKDSVYALSGVFRQPW